MKKIAINGFGRIVDEPVKVSHLSRMKVSRINEVLKDDSFGC